MTSNNFLKFDREDYKKLSNNAKIVYLVFVDIHPDINPTDKKMSEKSSLSICTYKKAKEELIINGILFVKRTGGKGANINYYFGTKSVKSIKSKMGKKEV